ncbi:MAG: ABC transporter substrate-binding protein [Gammaproteobacteria bacterium]
MKKLVLFAAAAMLAIAPAANAADKVFVGHLRDYTGATAFVGKHYGPGVLDALNYIIKEGGAVGKLMEFESVDYSYKIPQAVAQYNKWRARDGGMTALQGWGTGDTEALISFVARDQIPTFSASYSGHLTDPTGINPATKKPAPYNFFYGPSYSDGCRALVQWAFDDWQKIGDGNKPKFVHAGANHPYPEAPKKACAEYAAELGFEVLPPVVVSMKPGDFKAQCLTMQEQGTNYAFLANLGGSVVSLLKSCATVGTTFKFLGNIWAGDRLTMESAGEGAAMHFVAATPFWTSDAPGMKLVHAIAGSDDFRPHHYIRGVCSAFYMKEAMEWALENNGEITGAGIKQGMYARTNWVPKGLEGVCIPSTWTEKDHRGTMRVNVYSGVVKNGKAEVSKVAETTLPRREDWLGF